MPALVILKLSISWLLSVTVLVQQSWRRTSLQPSRWRQHGASVVSAIAASSEVAWWHQDHFNIFQLVGSFIPSKSYVVHEFDLARAWRFANFELNASFPDRCMPSGTAMNGYSLRFDRLMYGPLQTVPDRRSCVRLHFDCYFRTVTCFSGLWWLDLASVLNACFRTAVNRSGPQRVR